MRLAKAYYVFEDVVLSHSGITGSCKRFSQIARLLTRRLRSIQLTSDDFLIRDMERLQLEVISSSSLASGVLTQLSIQSSLEDRIQEAQKLDFDYSTLIAQIESGKKPELRVSDSGAIFCNNRLWVPVFGDLRREILYESHHSGYTVHPGSGKMYGDMKSLFWWPGMKKDVADFVARCEACQQGHDAIWVIVDRLTKSAHFLPIRQTDPVDRLAQVYVKEIVRLHGVPKMIVSDRDGRFTSRLWKGIQQGLGTKLHFSIAFHLQTDGHIGMAPYEALYDRKCRTPLTLTKIEDRQEMGATFVKETVKKVDLIKERFGRMSKLSPRYVGPYEILERIGKSAYRLLLSDQMSDVHNVFHVSTLRKWISDSRKKVSADEVEIQENLSYQEEPELILAYDVRKLRSKEIPMVKGQWKHRTAREATWEKESDMRKSYRYLF
ncbi:uncharacterized protein LOC114579209 [Dendrobium catenatum]|uniref:uncharacterized protein LOC114579209 n=1 Tax=Dendrobium catenatum TaxID=906689 RepID=UPI0010A019C4|nr:uncharacterized protein LOC114579209 [Dendrobium catenatum]